MIEVPIPIAIGTIRSGFLIADFNALRNKRK